MQSNDGLGTVSLGAAPIGHHQPLVPRLERLLKFSVVLKSSPSCGCRGNYSKQYVPLVMDVHIVREMH